MYFSVLGPLEVRDDALIPLRIAGDRRRSLVLRMLLVPNQTVSFDRLVDDVWGAVPRKGVRSPLAAHISLLRDQLGADRIRTEGTGYVLVAGPDEVDMSLFEKELDQAHLESARGDHAASVRTLTVALGRWRGDAFNDVGDQAWVIGSARRIEELRYSAHELFMIGRLALGEHHEVVAVATALVDQHPLRETGWAILMLALYRSSRQAEALRAYRKLVQVLGDELGIEPSPGLASLEEAIILQKPELDWSPTQESIDMASILLNVATYRHVRPPLVSQPAFVTQDTELAEVRNPAAQVSSPHTSFVGRDEELHWLKDHIRKGALVTLIGPAGVGKTRIALKAAEQHHLATDVDVRVVDLSAANRGDDVLESVAAALGIALTGGFRTEELLVGALSERSLLLLLDDCESVRDSCAAAARALLGQCVNLVILATSREPFDVPMETTYQVTPLGLPPSGDVVPIEDLASSPAVRLFTERACAHAPSFRLDASTADAVVAICSEADGIPLALELSAAQLSRISVFDLAQRLEDQLNLLSSSDPDVSAHLRSIRQSLDRSYETLSEQQRALLRYISVCVGTWSLTDIERMAPTLGMPRWAVAETLGDLVEKNLVHIEVQIDERPGDYRYRLLASIKRYAFEHLMAEGTESVTLAREAHAEAYLRASENVDSIEGRYAANDVDSAYPNLKVAMQYLAQHPQHMASALQMATSLRNYWPTRVTDGTTLLRSLLVDNAHVSNELMGRGYLVLGELLYMTGDRSASDALSKGLSLAREASDPGLCSDILSSLSAIEAFSGKEQLAMSLASDALAVATDIPDQWLTAKAFASNGLAAIRIDPSAAYENYAMALDIYTGLEQRWGMSDCLANLGLLDLCEGALLQGVTRLDEALRLARVGRHSSLECWVTVYSGFAALHQADAVHAETQFDHALTLGRARGLSNAVVHGLAGKAALLAHEGEAEHGARVLGAAEALRQRATESWHPAEESAIGLARIRLEEDLGSSAFSLAVLRGEMLSLVDSIALALDASLSDQK
jgi:predicted ATPase/DNA-binding SARP family transcriptional activator